MPVTIFGPDFPFAYDDWLAHEDGIGAVPPSQYGRRIGCSSRVDANGAGTGYFRIWQNRWSTAL